MQDTLSDYNTCKNLKQFLAIYDSDDFARKERYTMGFGKYKGTKVSQVPVSYFRWAKYTVNNEWICSCGYKLGDKKPEPNSEYAKVCPRCGADHSWGT